MPQPYSFIFHITLAAPYARLIRIIDIKVWNDTDGVLEPAAAAKWAGTGSAEQTIDLSADSDLGAVPVRIPAGLPAGEYDYILFDAGSPTLGDAEVLGKRIRWNGKKLLGLPRSL